MKNSKFIILLILLILLIKLLGLFEAINSKIYQNYMVLHQKKTISNEIIIIAFDDKTLRSLGKYQGELYKYFNALQIISQKARVVGLFLYLNNYKEVISFKKDHEYFTILNKLKYLSNIVVSVRYDEFGENDYKPGISQDKLLKGLTYAHPLVNNPSDTIVKSFPAYNVFPAFSLAVLKEYYKNAPLDGDKKRFYGLYKQLEDNYLKNKLRENMFINYNRSPKYFKKISFIDIVDKKVDMNLFTNKLVLIGVTDKYRSGSHVTPFTDQDNNYLTSTAVELQAQIIDSLLNHKRLVECPPYIVWLVSLAVMAAFLFLIRDKDSFKQGIYLLVFTFLLAVVNYTLFVFLSVWFPPALPFSLVIFCFFISEHLTTSKIDSMLKNSIYKLNITKSLPLQDIPNETSMKAATITTLLEVINNDRLIIKNILDCIRSHILAISSSGEVVWTNSHLIKDLIETQPQNRNVEKLFDDIRVENIIEDVTQTNFYQKEINFKGCDYLCLFTKLAGEGDKYVGIFNDITEIKEAARLKSDVVKIVSHEIRNPLASILICAENITFANEGNVSVTSAKTIIRSTKILLDLVNNYLNMSKLENRAMEVIPSNSNLFETVETVLQLNGPLMEAKNIEFKVTPHKESIVCYYDTNLILMVLNSLVTNAIKYSMKDGTITIKTEEQGDKILISIIDQGIGIPENELNKVFEKFYRSINNKESNIEGTGLGLALAKKIIDLHEQEIYIKSTVGDGTIVTFTLHKGVD